MRICLVILAFSMANFTLDQVHTPTSGSSERKAIMDALRVPTERDLKQKVIFKVGYLKVSGIWAFAMAEPLQPSGTRVKWERTHYAQEVKDDVFGFTVIAILKKSGTKWKCLGYDLGATDLGPVDTFMRKYPEAPKSIFPKIN